MGVRVTQDIRKHGIILRSLGDVLVIMPPLAIEIDEIKTMVTAVEKSINEMCGI
jgi:adenosylmethionine-8-amino-7-oxononanoate aminotransferase